MPDLREQIESSLQGRVCFLGVGNEDAGDDAFGVRLAEVLERSGVRDILLAGTVPEKFAGHCANAIYDHVVLLDAVEFRATPGSIIWLDADEIVTRFPQVSTHHISLGTVARWIEASGPRVWLLGAQPASLKPTGNLSPAVQTTVDALSELITGVIGERIAT